MNERSFDPRLTPARSHVAAARLRGFVDAERFVDGHLARVVAGVLDLKVHPRADAGLSTQLLHGEEVRVFDEREGWAFVQAERDGYVGYVADEGLGAPEQAGHRVMVSQTFVYPAPDMKRPVLRSLPLDAHVALSGAEGHFVGLADGGFVWADHVAAADATLDFVATAEGLLGTPYLWGGKSVGGIDCSGLVQLAGSLAGLRLPRDTDMQLAMPGWLEVAPGDARRRGDLVVWPGHVGIMSDGDTLLHASGHHMLVVREAVAAAEARIARGGAGVRAVRRKQIERPVRQPFDPA